jgi:predicted  nucleic acid-binding Zn-ribbon protein
MQDEKRDYLTDLIEDAEAHLDEHAEKCDALREQFDELKPDIQAVAEGPDVDEDEPPLDVLKARRDAFEALAAEAETLRADVAELYRELDALSDSAGPGNGGALDPLQDLDPFADEEELLEEARRVLERYQILRQTRFGALARSLAETEAFLEETCASYEEEAASIAEQIEALRSAAEAN